MLEASDDVLHIYEKFEIETKTKLEQYRRNAYSKTSLKIQIQISCVNLQLPSTNRERGYAACVHTCIFLSQQPHRTR